MKRPVPALIPVLILVSMLFIGILIFAYVETKKANPQMVTVGEVVHSQKWRVENPQQVENLPHIST